MMTYGEAIIYGRKNVMVTDGLARLPLPSHKPKMTKKDTVRYYNQKLFNYWILYLTKDISTCKQNKILTIIKEITNNE